MIQKIKSYAKCRDFLAAEIDNFEFLIEELHQLVEFQYKELYASQHLHILLFHVVPFFRLHHSWGRYAEQSVERCHQKVTRHSKRLKRGKKLAYAQKQTIFETSHFDKMANC